MYPQNLTAISLTIRGHSALHSGIGSHILAKTLYYFYRFMSSETRKLPPQKTAAVQCYNLIWSTLNSVYSSSTVSAMLKVASNKGLNIL